MADPRLPAGFEIEDSDAGLPAGFEIEQAPEYLARDTAPAPQGEITARSLGRYVKEGAFGAPTPDLKQPTAANLAKVGVERVVSGEATQNVRDIDQYIGELERYDQLPTWKRMLLPSDPVNRAAKVDRLRVERAKWLKAATDANAEAAMVGASPEMQAFSQAEGFGDALSALAAAPGQVLKEVAVPSLVQSIPDIPKIAAAGAIGGLPAAMLASGATAGQQDYRASILEGLQERGIDVANPEALSAALQDPAIMEPVQEAARKRSAVVGLAGGLGTAVGGRVLAPAAAGPLARELTNVAAQIPLQAAIEGGGEALAQTAAGQKLQPGEILGEVIGGGVSAPVEAGQSALGGYREQRAFNAAVAATPQFTQTTEGFVAPDGVTILGATPQEAQRQWAKASPEERAVWSEAPTSGDVAGELFGGEEVAAAGPEPAAALPAQLLKREVNHEQVANLWGRLAAPDGTAVYNDDLVARLDALAGEQVLTPPETVALIDQISDAELQQLVPRYAEERQQRPEADVRAELRQAAEGAAQTLYGPASLDAQQGGDEFAPRETEIKALIEATPSQAVRKALQGELDGIGRQRQQRQDAEEFRRLAAQAQDPTTRKNLLAQAEKLSPTPKPAIPGVEVAEASTETATVPPVAEGIDDVMAQYAEPSASGIEVGDMPAEAVTLKTPEALTHKAIPVTPAGQAAVLPPGFEIESEAVPTTTPVRGAEVEPSKTRQAIAEAATAIPRISAEGERAFTISGDPIAIRKLYPTLKSGVTLPDKTGIRYPSSQRAKARGREQELDRLRSQGVDPHAIPQEGQRRGEHPRVSRREDLRQDQGRARQERGGQAGGSRGAEGAARAAADEGRRPARRVETAREFGEKRRRSFLNDLRKQGRVTSAEMRDIVGERGLRGNVAGIFSRSGQTLDNLATWAHLDGYLTDVQANDVDGGAQAMRDLIAQALAGEPVMRIDERYDYEQRRRDESGQAQAEIEQALLLPETADQLDDAANELGTSEEGKTLAELIALAQDRIGEERVADLLERHESDADLSQALWEAVNDEQGTAGSARSGAAAAREAGREGSAEQGREPGGAAEAREPEARELRKDQQRDLFDTGDLFADQKEPAYKAESAKPLPVYSTEAELIKVGERTLGAKRILNVQDAADALAYLGNNAVERMDAVVTDAEGKPLAIIGNYKGTINAASVYPRVLVAEAIGLPGAKYVWMAHNHPSGMEELSVADKNLTATILRAFGGTRIEIQGLFAFGGSAAGPRRYQFVHANGELEYGTSRERGESESVEVVERLLTKSEKLGEQITSPQVAAREVMRIAGKTPGVLLLDHQHNPLAFIPWDSAKAYPLRDSGRLDELYEAAARANAAAAIIANPDEAYTSVQRDNLAGALQGGGLEINVLDVVEYVSGGSRPATSLALRGWSVPRAFAKAGPATGRSTKVSLRLAAIKAFGREAIERLERDGIIQFVNSSLELPSSLRLFQRDFIAANGHPANAIYDKGTTYFISEFIDPEHIDSLMLHEVGTHFGLKRMIGTERFRQLFEEIKRLHAEGNAAVSDAWADAEKYYKALKPGDPEFMEEVLALLGEDPRFYNASAWTKLKRWIREFLMKLGFKEREFTDEDIGHLVAASLRRVMDGEPKGFTAPGMARLDAAASAVRDKTNTPAFHAWFGNSRMRTRDGKPVPFYHASNARFDVFDKAKAGSNTGTPASGLGFFFTPKRETAERYGQHQVEVYLRMERPYTMPLDEFAAFDTVEQARRRAQELQSQGYDGIFIPEDRTAIVFDSTQAKSVNNRGTFDRADPSILAAAEGGGRLTAKFGRKPLMAQQAPLADDPTAIKNADVAKQRILREMPDRAAVARKADAELWENSKPQSLDDWRAIENLVESLHEKPRPVTDEEVGKLLHWKIRLENEHDALLAEMAAAHETGTQADVAEAATRELKQAQRLQQFYEATERVGTEQGRSLRARQILANRDYSLAKMVYERRAALQGRELTPQEHADVEKLSKRIRELEKQLSKRQDQKDAERASAQRHRELEQEVEGSTDPKEVRQKRGREALSALKDAKKDETPGADLGPLIQRLARSVVEVGVKDRTEVVTKVHAMLKGIGIDLSPREVMDAISGYGQFRPLSQGEVDVELRRIRGELQQVAKIEDLLAGQAPLKTGQERRELGDEERALIKQVNELKKRLGIQSPDDGKHLKSALDAVKQRLRNQIADYEHAIAKSERIVRAKGPGLSDAEVERLKAERDRARELYDSMFPKDRQLTDEQRLARAETAIERAIADYERRIKNGELFAGKKAEGPTSARLEALKARREALREELQELRKAAKPPKSSEQRALQAIKTRLKNESAKLQEKIANRDFAPPPEKRRVELDPEAHDLRFENDQLKRQYHEMLTRDRIANWTFTQKQWNNAKEAWGLARGLMTMGDVSAILRQGGFFLGRPIIMARAIAKTFPALWSDKVEHDIGEKILNRPNAGLYKRAGLYLAERGHDLSKREEVYLSRWLEKVPVLKHIYKGSERHYNSFLNLLRADVFDALVDTLARTKNGITEAELKGIAYLVNNATGRGTLVSDAVSRAAAHALFSPRYLASRFVMAAGVPILRAGSKRAAALVALEYVRYLTAMGLVFSLASMAGADEEDDPRSANWGKIRFGNVWIDPLGGFGQVVTLGARLGTGETVTGSGRKRELGEGFGPAHGDILGRFLRTKLAPMPGLLWTIYSGKGFDPKSRVNVEEWTFDRGDSEITLPDLLFDAMTPMSLSGALSVTGSSITEEEGADADPAGKAALIGASLLGVGVQVRD